MENSNQNPFISLILASTLSTKNNLVLDTKLTNQELSSGESDCRINSEVCMIKPNINN